VSILHTSQTDKSGNLSPSQLLPMNGPTIEVFVGRANPPDESGQFTQPEQATPALIDTGATDSCIDEDFAKTLGLPIIDVRTVGGVAGKKTT